MFFKGKLQDEEGYVLFIRKNAIQILIPKYGLECTLYIPQKEEGSVVFEYDEEVKNETFSLHCEGLLFKKIFVIFRARLKNAVTSFFTHLIL